MANTMSFGYKASKADIKIERHFAYNTDRVKSAIWIEEDDVFIENTLRGNDTWHYYLKFALSVWKVFCESMILSWLLVGVESS